MLYSEWHADEENNARRRWELLVNQIKEIQEIGWRLEQKVQKGKFWTVGENRSHEEIDSQRQKDRLLPIRFQVSLHICITVTLS
jgi:hypothetical protein